VAEKKISVIIAARDLLTSTLQGLGKSVRSWTEGVTKVAAGIGLADSFKEVGRTIKESIGLAAEAYPKLGAGLKQVGTAWTEFKITAGAAFLELLQPVIPLIQRVLAAATNLARKLPDAFDGLRITFANVSAAIRLIPAVGAEALAAFLRTIANFAQAAGTIFDRLFGVDVTEGLVASLDRAAAGLGASAAGRRRTVEGDRAAAVAAAAGATHDFGPRARTKEEQEAADKADRALQQEIDGLGKLAKASALTARDIERLKTLEQQMIAIRNNGTRSVEDRAKAVQRLADIQAALGGLSQGQSGEFRGNFVAGTLGALEGNLGDSNLRGDQVPDFLKGQRPGGLPAGTGQNDLSFAGAFAEAIAPLRELNREIETTDQLLGRLTGETLVALRDGFAASFEAIGRGGKVFDGLAKAAMKPLIEEARGYAKIQIGKGLIKLKEGIWPPNPAALLSGAGMVAAGGALLATIGAVSNGGGLSGGGGGFGAGGGLAPGRFERDGERVNASRGTLTVVWPRDAFVDPSNPGFQRMIAETIQFAVERRVGRVNMVPG
jgi:hypothetical protein